MNQLTQRNEPRYRCNELRFDFRRRPATALSRCWPPSPAQAERISAGAESALLTRERHRHALAGCRAAALRRALGALAGREDLLAEELRLAGQALGRLTGRVDVEDILDVIFRDFCIGK